MWNIFLAILCCFTCCRSSYGKVFPKLGISENNFNGGKYATYLTKSHTQCANLCVATNCLILIYSPPTDGPGDTNYGNCNLSSNTKAWDPLIDPLAVLPVNKVWVHASITTKDGIISGKKVS